MASLLVLSDTHLSDPSHLPSPLLDTAADCDLIVHCGDVGSPDVLDSLAERGEVVCVRGNTDTGRLADLPDRRIIAMEGLKIGVVHGCGALEDPAALLCVFHPAPVDVVMFGHTHRRFAEWIEGVLFLNPGAIRNPRDGRPSFAVLHLLSGTLRWKHIILE